MLRPEAGDYVCGLTGVDCDVPILRVSGGIAYFCIGQYTRKQCPTTKLVFTFRENNHSCWQYTPTTVGTSDRQYPGFTVSWHLKTAKGVIHVPTKDDLLAYHVALPRIAKELHLDIPFVYEYFGKHPEQLHIAHV